MFPSHDRASLNTNYGLCEKVETELDDETFSHVKVLGENGDVIDFDKHQSLSYILPIGEVESEELDGDVGSEITQRFNYPVHLVVFKQRCEFPELDEMYNIVQVVATNNAATLVNSSKAYQGAKILFNGGVHNKKEIWDRDFENKLFRISLDSILISMNFTIQLDLDLSCDDITDC